MCNIFFTFLFQKLAEQIKDRNEKLKTEMLGKKIITKIYLLLNEGAVYNIGMFTVCLVRVLLL